MSTRITLERDGHVLMIGINRPEKRNAFDLKSLDALAAAYEQLGMDDEVRVGLVQEVVPKGQQVDRARALGHLIAKQAPLSVQGTLANARTATTNGMAAAKEHLAALLPQILASEDAIEGVMSFTQRREPAFKGK